MSASRTTREVMRHESADRQTTLCGFKEKHCVFLGHLNLKRNMCLSVDGGMIHCKDVL